MVKAEHKRFRILNVITSHITNNLREYIVVSIMFLVGVFIGVLFLNNAKDEQKEEISSYINNYVSQTKEGNNVSTTDGLVDNLKDNFLLALGLWFAGTTLIGIPIVFGIILFRGFCLGYTISALTYTMGLSKGFAFILISIVLQNILFIPAIIALGVSGIKLYKSIIKDKRKENIKIGIVRHTVFSVMILLLLLLSAVIKVNISGGMIDGLIKYF